VREQNRIKDSLWQRFSQMVDFIFTWTKWTHSLHGIHIQQVLQYCADYEKTLFGKGYNLYDRRTEIIKWWLLWDLHEFKSSHSTFLSNSQPFCTDKDEPQSHRIRLLVEQSAFLYGLRFKKHSNDQSFSVDDDMPKLNYNAVSLQFTYYISARNDPSSTVDRP
jgi:hypothetical protein